MENMFLKNLKIESMDNKVFWATGIHPFNSPLPFAQNENFSLEQIIKETWKYASGSLHFLFGTKII